MEAGESKTIQIPPDKAFGSRREELLQEVPRDQLPDDIDPQPGQRLTVSHADGQSTTVTVASVSDSTVTLDANHPLADTNLNFDLELLEVG
jgi:FKBP-type peptidyl-prolyl cis-trans isomerase 2